MTIPMLSAEQIDEREAYQKDRQTLMDYLQLAFRLRDWHGVSDAANDLRVLEAAHSHQFDSGSPE